MPVDEGGKKSSVEREEMIGLDVALLISERVTMARRLGYSGLTRVCFLSVAMANRQNVDNRWRICGISFAKTANHNQY